MKLGETVKAYRFVQRLSLRAVAAEIGISSATLCRIENGYTVDQHVFTKLLLWLVTPKGRAA